MSHIDPVYPGLHIQLDLDCESKKQWPSFRHFRLQVTSKFTKITKLKNYFSA